MCASLETSSSHYTSNSSLNTCSDSSHDNEVVVNHVPIFSDSGSFLGFSELTCDSLSSKSLAIPVSYATLSRRRYPQCPVPKTSGSSLELIVSKCLDLCRECQFEAKLEATGVSGYKSVQSGPKVMSPSAAAELSFTEEFAMWLPNELSTTYFVWDDDWQCPSVDSEFMIDKSSETTQLESFIDMAYERAAQLSEVHGDKF